MISLFFVVITGNDVAGLGIKAADITLRGFSRRQESKADEFGLAVVNSEYGHVNEASRLFERWQETNEEFFSDRCLPGNAPSAGRSGRSELRAIAEQGRLGDPRPGDAVAVDNRLRPRYTSEKKPATVRWRVEPVK